MACDAPSALSLHYSGMADGPGEPYAIELPYPYPYPYSYSYPDPHPYPYP